MRACKGGPEVASKLKSRLVLRGDLKKGDFRADCLTDSKGNWNPLGHQLPSTQEAPQSRQHQCRLSSGSLIKGELLMKAPHTRTSPGGEGYGTRQLHSGLDVIDVNLKFMEARMLHEDPG